MVDFKKAVRLGLGTLLITTVLFTCIFIYNIYINQKVETLTEITFDEVTSQQALNFTSKFETETEILKTIATLLPKSNNVLDISMETLHDILISTSFENMAVIDRNGHGTYSTGVTADLSKRDYFKRSLTGETGISDPIDSLIRDAKIIVISTPIYFDGDIIGALIASHSISHIEDLLVSSFNGEGYSYIINNSGDIIAQKSNNYTITDSNNVFDTFKDASFYDGVNFDELRKSLAYNIPCNAKFTINGERRLLRYDPVGFNGWNMISIVPAEIITKSATEITFSTLFLSLVNVVVVLSLMLQLYRSQKNSIKKLAEVAYVDELTKAPTLARFKLEAQRFIDDHPNKKLLMVKFDVEKFKLINEVLGNDVGDTVLINLAKALRLNTDNEYDRFAHLHDDEFIVLHIYEDPEDLIEIRNLFKKRVDVLMGEDFNYQFNLISGHYYMSLENCTDINDAIKKANVAHRKAKESGVEICIYDETFIREALTRKNIENRMENALHNREFKVYLQPQYRLSDETIFGAEALVRWIPDGDPIMYPNDFIPIFEKNRFILQLDMYMFEESCKIIHGWLNNNITPVPISINFSRLHLLTPNYVQNLSNIADSYSIPHNLLVIEMTESIVFNNEHVLLSILNELHNKNFTLAMDDFGTGYSSLGLLKNIPVDVIKLDKSFFENAEDQVRCQAVLSNIINLADDLDIQTIAEGVETLTNVDILKRFGCATVQGYYYSKPIPFAEFTDKLISLTPFCNYPSTGEL